MSREPRTPPVILFASRDLVWSRPVRVRLRRRGAHVLVSTGVADLLDAIRERHVDLLVLDGKMTDPQSERILTLVRRSAPPTRVLFLPEETSPVSERSWRDLGVLYYTQRPLRLETLLDIITSLFRERLHRSGREKAAPKLLCVDDDPLYLRALERFLTRHGYRVATFDDPEQALDRLADLSPDLAILDVMMPKMNGLNLADEIRDGSRGRIPVVLLTARIGDQDISEGYRHGASYYITKPCEPRTVLNIVDYLVGNLDSEEREIVERQL